MNFKSHWLGLTRKGESCLYFRTFDVIDQKMHNVIRLFDDIEENLVLTTPIALAQVNKTLVALFMIMFPLAVHHTAGFMINLLLPALGALVFLMLEHMAVEMEVIFGLGRAHMDVLENLHQLEAECLAILRYGEEDHFKFTRRRPCVLKEFQWVKLPTDYHFRRATNWCARETPRWGLALASEAHLAEELYDEITLKTSATFSGATPSSSATNSRTLWADGSTCFDQSPPDSGRQGLVPSQDHVHLDLVRACKEPLVTR